MTILPPGTRQVSRNQLRSGFKPNPPHSFMITRACCTFSDRLWDLISLATVLSPLVVAGSLPAQPADRYSSSLDREAPRGTETIRYSVPNGRPDEISVLPRHLGRTDISSGRPFG